MIKKYTRNSDNFRQLTKIRTFRFGEVDSEGGFEKRSNGDGGKDFLVLRVGLFEGRLLQLNADVIEEIGDIRRVERRPVARLVQSSRSSTTRTHRRRPDAIVDTSA